MTTFRRNVPFLSFNQAIMVTGASLVATTAALVGLALAEDKSLATLPLAVQQIFVMITTIPAALLMDKIGRKPGFILASFFGLAGGVLAAIAISRADFWMFVTAVPLFGIHNGFASYYRFAAADAVVDEEKSRAVSWVMAGGVLAAFLGPNIAIFTKNLFSGAEFAGSFLVLSGIYLLSALSSGFLKLPHRSETEQAQTEVVRPLRVIVSQPKFIIAVICAMLGYGIMVLVMVATPIAMKHHAHSFESTALVIQWHVAAMFAPSFFTGNLIKRIGLVRILFTGGLLGLATVVINLFGNSLWHYITALIALGVSWNFLFIGATTLLTETYRPWERAKAQAFNDFIVFTTVSIASLSAGAIQHDYGWRTVNWGVLPFILIILISVTLLNFKVKEWRLGIAEV